MIEDGEQEIILAAGPVGQLTHRVKPPSAKARQPSSRIEATSDCSTPSSAAAFICVSRCGGGGMKASICSRLFEVVFGFGAGVRLPVLHQGAEHLRSRRAAGSMGSAFKGSADGLACVNAGFDHCSGLRRSFTTRRNARWIRSWASSSP